MNTHRKEADLKKYMLAIKNWEDDGGAPAPPSIDQDYGRRMETDQSWTIYHVFTGQPARIEGFTTAGLNRREATDKMLLLNRRAVLQRKRIVQRCNDSRRFCSKPAEIARPLWR